MVVIVPLVMQYLHSDEYWSIVFVCNAIAKVKIKDPSLLSCRVPSVHMTNFHTIFIVSISPIEL